MGRLIDADALVEALMMYTWHDEDGYEIDDCGPKRVYIKEWLPDIPTVDAVPVVHGKKLHQSPVDPNSMICFKKCVCKCSVCGEYVAKDWNYCSNCGAKMDQEDSDGQG